MNELEVKMEKEEHVFEGATRFDDLHENNEMMIVCRKTSERDTTQNTHSHKKKSVR